MFIYKITNTKNNKVYIGQTERSLEKRWSEHRKMLLKDTHYNQHLQAAWNKYGGVNFLFSLVEKFDNQMNFDINMLEKYWICHYNSSNPLNGYNKTLGGEGGSPSTETKKKQSLARAGKALPESTRQKIGKAHRGRVKSAQECQNISSGKIGKPVHSPEARQKISIAVKKRVISAETKNKLSEAAKKQWKRQKSSLETMEG